jgi:hypothetical protein
MGRSLSVVPQRRGRVGARRSVLAVLACAVALCAFGPLATAQAVGTSKITGKVSAVKGGGPLKGIEVSAFKEGVLSSSTTTNSAGEYTIPSLENGAYTVTFEDPTQTYLRQDVPASVVVEGETKTVDAALKESGAIEGVVTRAATGSPLANVNVFVSGPEGFQSTTTNGAGFYNIGHLQPGSYSVTFEASGYLQQGFSLVVGEGPQTRNAALTEGGKISGVVTDAYTHAGLAKIGVFANNSGGSGFAVTNANGEYTISGLPTGSYKLSYGWEFSEAEVKAFEKSPRFIPQYITQYYNGQPSEATANSVSATEGATTSGINVAMVQSAPHNAALPAVSGTPAVGSPLSCSSGSWTGEGLSLVAGWPLTSPFSYQWFRDGAPITGATLDTYVIQATDLGHGFVCEVAAAVEAGRASAKSASFAVALPVPVIKVVGSSLKAVKHLIKVSIACANATCKGTVKLVGTVLVKKKGKKKAKKQTVVFASGSYSLAAGKTGTVALKLAGAGKSALTHASHHREAVKILATVTGGKSVTAGARLTLVGH